MLRRTLLAALLCLSAWATADRIVVSSSAHIIPAARASSWLTAPPCDTDGSDRRWDAPHRYSVSLTESGWIGDDLQRRGIYATVASIVAITIYTGIRFQFSFAIGAIAATFHDILVTLACLSFAGYDLSLNVTAALLTVIGYSVNDTIVIVDRVRENAKALRGQPLASVVNLSVNQTLSRSVITASTTLLSVLSLYRFGGEALRGFAFTMLVGIVSGTYSTVFIASAIAVRLSRAVRGPHATRSDSISCRGYRP